MLNDRRCPSLPRATVCIVKHVCSTMYMTRLYKYENDITDTCSVSTRRDGVAMLLDKMAIHLASQLRRGPRRLRSSGGSPIRDAP